MYGWGGGGGGTGGGKGRKGESVVHAITTRPPRRPPADLPDGRHHPIITAVRTTSGLSCGAALITVGVLKGLSLQWRPPLKQDNDLGRHSDLQNVSISVGTATYRTSASR